MHHQCGYQKSRDRNVIVIKVSWFFLHVGLTNLGLVILAAMPCQLMCWWFCYWKCFCFCALALMQNLDTFKCKGIVTACRSLLVPWDCYVSFLLTVRQSKDAFGYFEQKKKTLTHSKRDCQRCHHCVFMGDGADVESLYFFVETMITSWGNFDGVIVIYWLQGLQLHVVCIASRLCAHSFSPLHYLLCVLSVFVCCLCNWLWFFFL